MKLVPPERTVRSIKIQGQSDEVDSVILQRVVALHYKEDISEQSNQSRFLVETAKERHKQPRNKPDDSKVVLAKQTQLGRRPENLYVVHVAKIFGKMKTKRQSRLV